MKSSFLLRVKVVGSAAVLLGVMTSDVMRRFFGGRATALPSQTATAVFFKEASAAIKPMHDEPFETRGGIDDSSSSDEPELVCSLWETAANRRSRRSPSFIEDGDDDGSAERSGWWSMLILLGMLKETKFCYYYSQIK